MKKDIKRWIEDYKGEASDAIDRIIEVYNDEILDLEEQLEQKIDVISDLENEIQDLKEKLAYE